MKAYLPLALLAFSAASVAAQDQATPAAQYRDLLKAYNTVSGAFRSEGTDQQRRTVVERMDEFPQKFLDLADKHRADPVALQALRQAVQVVISVDSAAIHCGEVNREAFPRGNQDGSASRIVTLLLRDHLESNQLGPICDRMRWGARLEFETFLSAALEKNSHRNVQGLACLAFAQLKHTHLRMLDLVESRPELSARYDRIFGKGYVEQLKQTDRPTRVNAIETLYERAAQFDDVVNFPFSHTVAERARSELYDLQHLSVGKAAPDMAGQDQHARPMKLSDHRGKVVLLYFWSEY